jgi:hypothetical protein
MRDLDKADVEALKHRPLPLIKTGKRAGQPRPAVFRVADRLYLCISETAVNHPDSKAKGNWLLRYTNLQANRQVAARRVANDPTRYPAKPISQVAAVGDQPLTVIRTIPRPTPGLAVDRAPRTPRS